MKHLGRASRAYLSGFRSGYWATGGVGWHRDIAAWKAGYDEGIDQRRIDLVEGRMLPKETETGPVPSELALNLKGIAERNAKA